MLSAMLKVQSLAVVFVCLFLFPPLRIKCVCVGWSLNWIDSASLGPRRSTTKTPEVKRWFKNSGEEAPRVARHGLVDPTLGSSPYLLEAGAEYGISRLLLRQTAVKTTTLTTGKSTMSVCDSWSCRHVKQTMSSIPRRRKRLGRRSRKRF